MSVFTNYLSQSYQTFAPDLRGYGKSKAQGKFEMQQHLEDLEELLDHFKIKNCLVLGWSLGGILAMELALKFPQRIQGLILVATAAYPRSSHPRVSNLELASSAVAGIVNWIRPGWQWNIDTFGKRSLFRYLVYQQTPASYHYLAKEGTTAYLQTSRHANQALNLALKSRYNRLEALHQITCPCLVLAGSEDRHITPQASFETAQHLPNADWKCYPNTAHLFPWEIPAQVLQDLESWLKQNQPEIMNPKK
jgi:pimeloyl-ACP methyl ester carboxylesterase